MTKEEKIELMAEKIREYAHPQYIGLEMIQKELAAQILKIAEGE